MSALLTRPTRRKSTSSGVRNHRLEDRGKSYRIVATDRGRVLWIALKHKHSETALEPKGRRFREVMRAAKATGIALTYPGVRP
jgi:hypothetical protein